jgi:hypothetical protein
MKPIEIVAAFMVIAFIAVAVTYYWTSLRPEQARLRGLEKQLGDQQRELVPMTSSETGTSSPADAARDSLESLDRFKSGHLRPIRSGEIELLNELNTLAKKSNVQLTSGIDTTSKLPSKPDDETSVGKKAQKQRKPEELLNVYPALAVRLSVAGDYNSLRNFISELESSKQFLVVKTISIINQEGKVTGRSNRRSEAAGGLVLSIEMTSYFRP